MSNVPIKWKSEWSVGNETLDGQHQQIISLINLYFNEDFSNIQKDITFPQTLAVMKNHLSFEHW